MLSPTLFATYALTGLLSGAHCAGMCGGLVGAINLCLPQHGKRAHIWIGLSAGRITGYVVGGFAAGAIGWALSGGASNLVFVQRVLAVLAGVLLILMGLAIMGWSASIIWTERLGKKVWARIQPIWQRFLPPRTFPGALMAGLLWGWLPCGLVYGIWISALASGDPLDGALIMFAFGLGTLPNVLTLAWLSRRFTRFLQNPLLRRVAGAVVIVAGVQQLIR